LLALPTTKTPIASSGHEQVPAPLNTLIGRADAVQETLQLLNTTRCLTFTGAGGSGKTRLALELASLLQTQYDGCVWWVELVNVRSPEMLLATIARTLGIADPSKDAFQNICDRMHGRSVLLVMDNCEQLIEDCAVLAVQLLRTLPQLQLLVTSREVLSIAGEMAWAVPPLQLPSATEVAGSADDLTRVASVQLLLERIRQKNSKFALTKQNAPSLVRICREPEGLPLALELIAATVGVQTLEQIVASLDDSLRLLTGGRRGDMQHHQTMHAAAQWSFDLLSVAEQTLFTRLSVFAGGWKARKPCVMRLTSTPRTYLICLRGLSAAQWCSRMKPTARSGFERWSRFASSPICNSKPWGLRTQQNNNCSPGTSSYVTQPFLSLAAADKLKATKPSLRRSTISDWF